MRTKPPMRIALVTHNVVTGDGQGRVNYEIARYALRRGARVTLLADQVAPELLEQGVAWWPIHPRMRWPNLLKVPEFAWRANRLLKARERDLDVVCGNGYVLSRRHAVNCAHFVHGAWLRSPFHTFRVRRDGYGLYQLIYTTLNAAAERRVYGRGKFVVAVSAKVAQELASIGVPEGKISIIPNGVDIAEFRPGPADRRSLGLPSDLVLALFIGDLRSPIKNLDIVLKALLRVPDVHLAVVGDTDGSVYPLMAKTMGLSDRIHFLGYRRDVPDIMRMADVFVSLSRYDSFGLAILEAMASSLPVITARSVGASTLVVPECGYALKDPDDVEGLGTALDALAGDPERRRRMGRAARRVAEANSWERMAAAYWELFEGVR